MERWYYELVEQEYGKEFVGVIIEALEKYTKFLQEPNPDGLNSLSDVTKKAILLAIKHACGYTMFKPIPDGAISISRWEHCVFMLKTHENPSDKVTLASDLLRFGSTPARMVKGFAGELEVKKFSDWVNTDDVIPAREKKLAVLWYIKCLYGDDINEFIVREFIETPIAIPLKLRIEAMTGDKNYNIPESIANKVNQYSFCNSPLFKVLGEYELNVFFDRINSFIEKEELTISSVNFAPIDRFIDTDVPICSGICTNRDKRIDVINNAVKKDSIRASLSFVALNDILNVFFNCSADLTYQLVDITQEEQVE